MTNQNFITIQGWMLNSLDLKSNELLVFALIYGFSQDNQSKFTGSLRYIQNTLNIGRNTAIRALASLTEKEYINKDILDVNGVTFCHYSFNSGVVSKKINSVPEKGSYIYNNNNNIKTSKRNSDSSKTREFKTLDNENNDTKDECENNTGNTLKNKESEISSSKDLKNTSTYGSIDFLKDYNTAREYYLKTPSNFNRLNFNETNMLKEALKVHSKEDIQKAINGLFLQKNVPTKIMIFRPKHLLENIETYIDAQEHRMYDLYSK